MAGIGVTSTAERLAASWRKNWFSGFAKTAGFIVAFGIIGEVLAGLGRLHPEPIVPLTIFGLLLGIVVPLWAALVLLRLVTIWLAAEERGEALTAIATRSGSMVGFCLAVVPLLLVVIIAWTGCIFLQSTSRYYLLGGGQLHQGTVELFIVLVAMATGSPFIRMFGRLVRAAMHSR